MTEKMFEAVVIGSGFGGAINACRLSRKWPGHVRVLERGKRYPLGSFPRSPYDFARNIWNVPHENRSNFQEIADEEQHGIYDVRSFQNMDVVQGAGLGGTSLIYANVFLLPPDQVFAHPRWPETCRREHLGYYYDVAKSVLGSRPIPGYDSDDPETKPSDPRRRVLRTELFREVARKNNRESRLCDLNVFFGNDFDNPLPIGEQDENRFGALQTSCVYCGECMIGCNYQSKNTVDLNYLYVAEHVHKAEILTECLVEAIVPVDGDGQDDPAADGAHGYRVYHWDMSEIPLKDQNPEDRPYQDLPSTLTKRVIVSAGSLGTTELLMRCRDYLRSLPNISQRLGEYFSGNGDFLSFALRTEKRVGSTYGPVITQYTDYNLFKNPDPKRAFIVEDAAFPNIMAWMIEGIRPGFSRTVTILRALKDFARRFAGGRQAGRVGSSLRLVMGDAASDRTAILLNMGVDESDGRFKLGPNNRIRLDWPYRNSIALYRAIISSGAAFARRVWAGLFLPLLTWTWPFRRNITVHPLGGCILASEASEGVTNSERSRFGEVFGYKGLYVADGALVPSAVGSNPSATIAALSEMVAEGITEEKPTADL